MTRHGTAIALALVAPLALGAAGASSASASPLGTGAGKVPSAYESRTPCTRSKWLRLLGPLGGPFRGF